MERRRYGRLVVPLSVQYRAHHPETGEVHQGQCVTRDISLGGVYLFCESPFPIRAGQILDLTIAAPLPYLDLHDTSHLRAQGEVLRLDPPGPDSPHWGAAVAFQNNLTFSSL
jgi:c-di-GMP-binding flagellar brake protein YcgR